MKYFLIFDVCAIQEILKLCYGDSLSNAVLLTCFLQHLDMEAWLLVGWGLTRGPSHFVLTKNKQSPNELSIWDVATGTKSRPDDPFCPATFVWAVANQDNVSPIHMVDKSKNRSNAKNKFK
jgi:hypothetical protein